MRRPSILVAKVFGVILYLSSVISVKKYMAHLLHVNSTLNANIQMKIHLIHAETLFNKKMLFVSLMETKYTKI